MTRLVVLGLLSLAVLLSALGVVMARHESRKVFVEIEELQKTRDNLNEEWGKLQLEEGTWGTNVRVEELARTKLGMVMPSPDQIVVVRR